MSPFLNPGEIVLGRFAALEVLAYSGQAMVYKGRDRAVGTPVAIKQLHLTDTDADTEAVQRFVQEGNLRFGNPHILDPIAYGQDGKSWYLVLDYIEGLTLGDLVPSRGGKLPPQETVEVIDQVAAALAAMHEARVIHRDIKPQNIMIAQDGNVFVIDLGIAKCLRQEAITQVPGPIGTWLWMSPEQISGDPNLDHRSDLYSVGAVWYWMLTGTSPVSGQPPDEIRRNILRVTPPAPSKLDPTIPRHISDTCMKLLAKSPACRIASARDLRQILRGPQIQVVSQVCHSCGHSIDAGTVYCSTCGAQMMVANQLSVCLACGTAIAQGIDCPGCHRSFSPANHRLCFLAGTIAGREFRIPEGLFITGRTQLSPRDHNISKAHLHVAATNGTVHIQDAGSVNLTFVDGQVARSPTRLRPGSQISIAGNLAVYQSH
jgi:hypothetical protein